MCRSQHWSWRNLKKECPENQEEDQEKAVSYKPKNRGFHEVINKVK
jgi:hypothetical protein